MYPISAKVRTVTRRAFFVAMAALAVETGIGVAIWPSGEWHEPVAVAGLTTYLFAATFGILLAGERWPALGNFVQLHSAVVVAFVIGSAAAILGYLVFPDPVMLILGPVILAFLVLVGWGVQKARTLLGF